MNKLGWLLISFFLVSSNAASQSINLSNIYSAYESNGLFKGQVLVAQNNKVLFTNAKRSNAPAVFEIGSLAKQFTAALVLKLKNEQRLSLIDPVESYVEEFSNSAIGKITIEQLLKHQSGLPRDFVAIDERKYFHTMNTETRGSLLASLSVSDNKKRAYSNAGYALLAHVVEKITGNHFSEVLHNKLLNPASLHFTGVLADKQPVDYQNAHIKLHNKTLSQPYHQQAYAIGHGAMYSTVQDLNLWIQQLLSYQLLPKNDVDYMLNNNIGFFQYTYNWPENQGEKGRAITHSGSNEAFAANLSVYLDHHLVVVSLANQQPVQISSMYNQLANHVLGMSEPLPFENFQMNLYKVLFKQGHAAAKTFFEQAESSQRWDIPSAGQVNKMGYLYLENGFHQSAVDVFQLLVEIYPKYDNGKDSLREALSIRQNSLTIKSG